MESVQEYIFKLILHGGNGRSSAMEAIAAAKREIFQKRVKSLHKLLKN